MGYVPRSPVLQEIPTRISLPTSNDIIVDLPDDDEEEEDDHNTSKKGMLHPTILEGNAAILIPLPHLEFSIDFDLQ